MTVTTAYSVLTSNCNGSVTAFSVTWPFFQASDLVVTHISATGVETVLTLTTHYTVSGGRDGTTGLPGTGTVTTLTAYASGHKIRISRATPKTQQTSITSTGAFPAKTVEAMIDRVHMIAEEGSGGPPVQDIDGSALRLETSGATNYWDGENYILRNLAEPTEAADAATKDYVDTVVAGSAYPSPIDIESGGTGVETLTQYGVLVGNGTSPIHVTSAGASGYALIGNGADNPTFQGFTQSGTGAIARMWQDKMREVRSVLDFIPVAEHAAIKDRTTTTDVTSYIVAAIASLPTAGGVIDFPEGLYISDVIRTPALGKPTWFRGAGRGRTIIQALSANTPIFAGVTALDVSSPYLSPHRHTGFTCKAHASGSTGAAIDMRKWSFSEVSDIGFAANGSGKWAYGILLDATDHCYSNRIDDVAIIVESPITTAVVRGVGTANHHVLSRFTIVGTTVAAVVSLANAAGLYGWKYQHWHIEGVSGVSTVAFDLQDGNFRQDFIGCWFEDVGDCFSNTSTTTGSVQSCTFSGGNVQGIGMPPGFDRRNCSIPSDSGDVSDHMTNGGLTLYNGSLRLSASYGLSWDSSDVVISHATNALAFTGATSGYSFQDGPVTAPNANIGNGGRIGTTFSLNDDFSISAWDVDGAAWVDFITLNAANTPTCDLADSVTKAGAYIYRAGGTDVPVTDGGTGLSSGTSGGVPYFSGTTTMASSGALTANALVKGGGAGAAPAASGITCDGSNNLSGIGTIANTGSITMTNGSLRVSDGYAGLAWDNNYIAGSSATDQISIVCNATEQMALNGATGGVVCGAPTGSFKGVGTINAVGVYDDNTLLTDYVFDAYLGTDHAPYTAEIQARADALDRSMFDAKTYADHWRAHGRLWGMPDLDDCIDGRVQEMSLGALVQRLWQAVELQAIHIEQLRRKLEERDRFTPFQSSL